MTAARRPGPRRSGITLTECLIAILIMGVGLISLATLFPLGLLRLREGTRLARSGTAAVVAFNDLNVRSLLDKPTFRTTWYGVRDPFTQDAYVSANGTINYNQSNTYGSGVLAAENTLLPANNIDYANGVPGGDGLIVQGLTTGLPICYDPLWRSLTGVAPYPALNSTALDFGIKYVTAVDEARFGSGLFAGATPYIQTDLVDGGLTSAHGLQRLTNFIPWSSAYQTPQYPFTCTNFALAASSQPPDVAGNIFTSVDDLVYNPAGGEVKVRDSQGNVLGTASSLLPDLSSGGPQADYRFSWFFTGNQTTANGNGGQFTGQIVVCDGRPFGFDPLPGGTASAPTGETVVEAVYGVGLGASVVPLVAGGSVGFAVNDRTVLLRWSSALADPAVRVGGWICDTTYERSTALYRSRAGTTGTTFARCNWYQINKKTEPQAEVDTTGTTTGYRTMVVTLASPLKAKTLISVSTGQPVHRNVALIMPSVVNVFARSFEIQGFPQGHP